MKMRSGIKRTYLVERELYKYVHSKSEDYSSEKKDGEVHPREARLLQVFELLEESISILQGFICGDFLIYYPEGESVESLPEYLSQRLCYLKYEMRRKEHTFYRAHQPQSWSKGWERGQRTAYEELRKNGLLFSKLMRGADTEKSIVIIHCTRGMGVHDFFHKLDDFIGKDPIKRAKIKLIRLTHSSLFGENKDEQHGEFEHLSRTLGLRNPEFNAEKLEMYISKMDKYAPDEAVPNGWFIVYCPATFITSEPPANFWGLFSAEEISEPPVRHETYEEGQPRPTPLVKKRRRISPARFFIDNIQDIQSDVTKIMAQVVGLYAERRRQQFLQQARKAAVAAIMSRNMSHNIGSHVLARLSSVDGLESTVNALKFKEPLIEKDHVDALVEKVVAFNSYLRTRMDFLADLATTVPVVTLPKKLYGDVCVYFKPFGAVDVIWQELLMDHISGTNIGKDRIIIKVRFDDQDIKLKDRDKDPVFACPNDMLGAHALYTILENIIRNCAKHSQIPVTNNSKLELAITVEDASGDAGDKYWKVQIVDNLGECRRRAELSPPENLALELNQKIKAALLAPEGSLRQGGWGLLEMKIAAAYLRKIESSRIDSVVDDNAGPSGQGEEPPDGLNILKAFEQNGNLGYVFYLLKPKQVLFIEFGQSALHEYDEQWRSKGLDVCNYLSDEYEQLLHVGASHDFLVLMSPSTNQYEALKAHEKELPSRVFLCAEAPLVQADHPWSHFISSEDVKRVFSSNSPEQIVEYFWENWTGLRHGEDGLSPMLVSRGPDCTKLRPIFSSEIPAGEDLNKWILLDRHGDVFQKCGDPEQMLYYEPFESKSPTGVIFLTNSSREKAGQQREQRTLPYELYEAATLRVTVVDERIQQEAEKSCGKTYRGIVDYVNNDNVALPTYGDILRWMKINVLRSTGEQGVDLNKQLFDLEDKTIMEREVEMLAPESDFLVIHLGLIEKAVGTDKNAISDWIAHWGGKFPEVVVISGRGKPSNIPDKTRFLHYSLVARYLFEERSKFHLCKVLRSARRAT